MELILISENKLKIMLSPDDMQKYEITCDNVDYGNTETRRAFWSILDQAKRRTGFDAASERVYIQLYPSKDGGCEMYVTKIGIFGNKKGDAGALQKVSRKEQLAYAFPDIKSLLCVCRALSCRNTDCKSRAYTGDNGQCMLFLSADNLSRRRDELGFIDEFGCRTEPEIALTFASEHYKCICKENAIETLACFA